MHPEFTPRRALRQALQADTLSLVSWQVGMYAVMCGASRFGQCSSNIVTPLIPPRVPAMAPAEIRPTGQARCAG
jgi:Domain of unknown function (DUF4396)